MGTPFCREKQLPACGLLTQLDKYKPWAWETSSPRDESSWPCWICHLMQEDPPWAPLFCLSMHITQHMASPTVSSVPFGEGQGWEDQPNGASCPAGPAGCRQPTHWGWFCSASSPRGGSMVKNLPAMQETWVGVENIPWRRKCQPKPTPGLLPGEPHGQRSLAGYSPWGHKESDMTEHTCSSLLR